MSGREPIRSRLEPWGEIVYEAERDEFTAYAALLPSDEVLGHVRPLSAGCVVTGRCNLQCGFCYGNEEALPKQEVSAGDWQRIFARLRAGGIMRVDLSGGEPTIRKDIGEIAGAASREGLNVVLSTNGTILGTRGLESLPADVRLHVSLDSGFEEVHAASRLMHSGQPSRSSFALALECLREAVAEGRSARALTAVGPHNVGGLFQLGETLALMGVIEWNVSRILPAGRARDSYDATWAVDDCEVLRQVHAMRHAFPWLRISYSSRVTQNGYFLLVLPDGKLATQFTDERDKVVVGEAVDLEVGRIGDGFDVRQHFRKWISAWLPPFERRPSRSLPIAETRRNVEEDFVRVG